MYCCDKHYDRNEKYIGCAKGAECKGQQWYHYFCGVQRFGAPSNLMRMSKKQVAKLQFVCSTCQAPAAVEEKDVVDEPEDSTEVVVLEEQKQESVEQPEQPKKKKRRRFNDIHVPAVPEAHAVMRAVTTSMAAQAAANEVMADQDTSAPTQGGTAAPAVAGTVQGLSAMQRQKDKVSADAWKSFGLLQAGKAPTAAAKKAAAKRKNAGPVNLDEEEGTGAGDIARTRAVRSHSTGKKLSRHACDDKTAGNKDLTKVVHTCIPNTRARRHVHAHARAQLQTHTRVHAQVSCKKRNEQYGGAWAPSPDGDL